MPPPSGAFFLLPNRCTLEGDAYQPSAPEGRMLLSWFRRFALSIVFLFAMGSAALAQFPLPLGHVDQDTRAEQMRELVSKYCRLDYDGARMAPVKCASWFPNIAAWIMTGPEWPPRVGRNFSPWCGGRRIPTTHRRKSLTASPHRRT